ncbi:MAG: Pup--protein ligase [Candidatus Entotheonella factor]|uniref:Pup--protein ligase n=2 Tax=Candidatus Entotheonella TaxID=93171 RepID=W4LY13_ENTF1|nr:MAG: Pup--protein ligase [Candidatus Entotheonella factor]
MKKRIYGLENEFGIAFTSHGRRTLPSEKVVRYLFEKLITTEGFLNVFLENGARFYLDTGCHPEYATPECASPLDVTIYDKAGERILENLLQYAQGKVREEGFHGNLAIFKNNTDFVGNSYGCHENYLAERTSDFYYMAEQLIPFLVTRQIFTGAGKVFRTRRGTVFHISQRAQHIRQKISGTTTNERSIINTRDEPHAIKEKYRRLHIIVGDSNMSEYTTYLKVGTTAIILEMIEDDFITPNFSLRNPVRAIKDISRDLTCREQVPLNNGKKYSALELQKEYLELAHRYYSTRQKSEMVTDILDKWEEVLTKLEEDPMQLHRKVDWVTKMNLLKAYGERTKQPSETSGDRMLMLDLQYHDIRRDKGLYYLLERKDKVERVTTDEAIDKAMVDPPQNTRAKMRGELIKLAKMKRIPYDLDWNYIRIGYLLNLWVKCNDPFQEENEKVTQLKRRIERSNFKYGYLL